MAACFPAALIGVFAADTDINVNNGAYSSDYKIRCGSGKTFSQARTLCTGLGAGWDIASVPTTAAKSGIDTALGGTAAWIGGSDVGGGRWEWLGGREGGNHFSQGAVCQGAYVCPWNGAEPAGVFTALQILGTPDAGDWSERDPTTTRTCYVCEQSSCSISADCVAANTASVSGTWNTCTCSCKDGYAGSTCQTRVCHVAVDCIAAHATGVAGTYPYCVCACNKGYSGRCRTTSATATLSHIPSSTYTSPTLLVWTRTTTDTPTHAPTTTRTPVATRTPTISKTLVPTSTHTPTSTVQPTATRTVIPTPTATFTPTHDPTATWTILSTPTATSTETPTSTFSASATESATGRSPTTSGTASGTHTSTTTLTILTLTYSTTPSLFVSFTQVLTPSSTVTVTRSFSVSKSKSQGTPSHSVSASDSRSDTQSQTLSLTASESRVLIPPSLKPFVGTSNTPYIHRYYYYPPARFVGTYSGIPLVFSRTFHHLFARRFLSTDVLGRTVRFSHAIQEGTQNVSVFAALTRSGGSAASVYKATIGTQTFAVGQFALLQNRTAFSDSVDSFQCGDLMTADPIHVAVSGGTRADVTLTAPLDAMSSECNPSAPFSGIVFTPVALQPTAALSYLALVSETANTTDELSAFRSGWRGAADAALLPSGDGVGQPAFIGDPLNTKSTPYSARKRTVAAAYPQLTAARESMRIAADTTDAMLCTVGDTLSYAGRYVAPGANISTGFASNCFAFDTVEAMHAACDASPTCIGFTTVVMPAFPGATTVFHEIQGKELPLCLYVSGANPALDSVVYQRMFYEKPTQGLVACAVPVARSGSVAVYVQQTDLSSGLVVVRLNGKVLARCGGERLFANGFGGVDGQCGAYALCVVTPVLVNATIEVSAPSGLRQMGCRNSLGVIVEQIAVDTVQVIDDALIPIARLNVTSIESRAVARPHGQGDALNLFVFAASHAALDVVQTAFSCALAEAAFGNGSCPTSVVSFSSQHACQSCGGQAGFFANHRNGRSDECSTRMFCGDFLPLKPVGDAATCAGRGLLTGGDPYTGVISVSMNFTRVAQQTDICSGLIGSVYARPTETGADAVPVFPLVGAGAGLFQVLLGVPHGSGAGAAGMHLGDAGLGDRITRLMTVGPVSARLDAYYVPWAPLLRSFNRADDTWQQRLQPNTTLICVVDHNGGAPSRCAFPVPRGATKVRVRASQADFATKAMSVAFQTGRYPAATPSVVCGNRRRFSGALGGEGRCDGFETCTDQYIYALDTYADEATSTHVVVELPADLEYHGCNLTATIIAEFSRPLGETSPCAEFECPGERRCIPYAAVCDQVSQCTRGTDEEACYTLHPLPNEMFCNSRTQTRIDGAGSLIECRRAAVVRQSPAFTLVNGSCIVYGTAETNVIFDSPSTYVCSAAGATTYLYLAEGVSQYRMCRASVHCAGNGVLASGTSATCLCSCFEGFSGDTCSDRLNLETIANVVIALPVSTLADSIHINRNVVASALRLESTSVSVACGDVTPMNDTAIYVACVVTSLAKSSSAYFHSRTLLSPKALSSVNQVLAQQYHPAAFLITTRGLLNPVTYFGACNASGSSHDCPVAQSFERLRISSVENRSVLSMRVAITDPTRRSGTASRREYSCTPAATSGSGGCITSTCDLPVSGSSSSLVTVSDIVFANATLLTSACLNTELRSSGAVRVGNLPVITNTTVSNELTDFNMFFIGGIICFMGGTFLTIAIGAVCIARYWRGLREIRRECVSDSSLSSSVPTVAALMQEMLVKQIFEQRCERERKFHPRRWAYGLLIVGMACGVLASFLTIYYKTAYGVESNFSVMYEEYSDSRCQASDISSMPRRIFAVAPGTYQCTKMQAAGESVGAVYALGRCTGSDGDYSAVIRIGGSLGICAVAQEVTVPSGGCVPLSTLSPGTTRNVFVSLTCSDAARVGARIDKLDTLTALSEEMVETTLLDSWEPVRLTSPVTSSGVINSGYIAGSSQGASSSKGEGVVDTQAGSADFDGDDNDKRIVLQSSACTFLTGDHTACLASAASALRPLMGSTLTSPLAPTTADAPIGFVFGGFGTSQPETWIGAGSSAHRYYDVASTTFDMGAHFPKNSAELIDGEGYSISLYMRADAETLGFAYAVTDAFENSADGYAYTLHRLARIIDNGQGSGSWYNHTYRVYHSLYVNGPGRSLIVAYADPDFASRVQLLEFDLVAIGMERVFNGLWHHIAVVFLVENGKARAQLMVDGETSYSKKGWSACVDTFPAPITAYRANTSMPVYSVATDSVRNRGMLVTGYFNGGIYALQAATEEKASTDYLVAGTAAMRSYNAFPREQTLYLGLASVGVAAILVIIAATDACVALRRRVADKQSVVGPTAQRFYRAVKECQGRDSLFSTSKDTDDVAAARTTGSQEPVPRPGSDGFDALLPVRFTTVLRWTGLSAEEMATAMDGIEQLAEDSAARILLFVMQVRMGDPKMEALTIAEWNAAAMEEKDKEKDKEDEIALVGRDLHRIFFTVAVTTTPTTKALLVPSARLDAIANASRRSSFSAAGDDSDGSEHGHGGDGKGRGGDDNDEVGAEDADAGDDEAEMELEPPPELGSLLSSLGGLLAPVVVSVQVVFVWMTSVEMPSDFSASFRGLFSFFSVDFAATFPQIPTLITPLLQLFAGLLTIGFVLHFMVDDNSRFEKRLAQYVWRRDEIEGHSPPVLEEHAQAEEQVKEERGGRYAWGAAAFTTAAIGALDARETSGCDRLVEALPLSAAHRVDQQIKAAEEGAAATDDSVVHTAEGDALVTRVQRAAQGLAAFFSPRADLRHVPKPKAAPAPLPTSSAAARKRSSVDPTIVIQVPEKAESLDGAPPSGTDPSVSGGRPSFHSGDGTTSTSAERSPQGHNLRGSRPSDSYHTGPMDDDDGPGSFTAVQTMHIVQSRAGSIVAIPRRRSSIVSRRSPQNEFPGACGDGSDGFVLVRAANGAAGDAVEEEPFANSLSLEQPPSGLLAIDGDWEAPVEDAAEMTLIPTMAVLESPQGATPPARALTKDPSPRARQYAPRLPPRRGDSGQGLIMTKTGHDKTAQSVDCVTVERPERELPNASSLRQIRGEVHGTRLSADEQRALEGEWRPLEEVGGTCRFHANRRLTPQQQTGVYPYSNVPMCCLVVNGQRCGEACGTIYHCGHTHTGEDGQVHVCTYALCERHCRLSISQELAARCVGLYREVRRHGFGWLLCLALMFVANIAYTPFIKTALMILGCHPYYQCEFTNCWSQMDQKYALAVYLAIVVIIIFGVGFPAALLVLLWRRRSLMRRFFLDESYEGRYEEVTRILCCEVREIAKAEWARFVSTDGTVLSREYDVCFSKWMFVTGILVFFKVLTMIPALFLEPRSFDQRLGIMAVEMVVAVFFFFATTQLSPISMLGIRAGCIFRILIAALQNLSLVQQNDSGENLGGAMIATTVFYFLFNIVLVIAAIVAPVLLQRYRQRQLRAFFDKYNVVFVDEISLFLDPLVTHPPLNDKTDSE